MTGTLLIAVPLLPLLAAAGALLFGRRLPGGGGLLPVAALILSLGALMPLRAGGRVSATWFAVGRFQLDIGLESTGLTWFVAVVVAAVALCVSVYSIGYMREDTANRPRFFAGMGLFAGAMLTLVLSSSLLLLFAGWELVGLASYLLIGFRSREPIAVVAATKAFLMTRLGDMGLLLGWLLILGSTGTTEIGAAISAAQGNQWAPGLATLIALLLFAGAVGKSAQLPLTAWLPDAMVGPTPVSALLHSATMVAAGVFLLLRLFPLFQAAPVALAAVFWVGAVTAILSALIATAEMDLKRILAWSTSGHLGEMMVAIGFGIPYAAALHLATHAAFKATLFTAAGSLERRAGTRDLRRLGRVRRAMPVTAAVFVVGSLSLAGIPPFSGFWSEEAILSAAVAHGIPSGILMLALTLLSGIYIGRAAIAAFGGQDRAELPDREGNGPRVTATMLAGMIVLAAAAAGAGWLLAGPGLASLIGMARPEEPGRFWQGAAVAAALAGLGMGGSRAWIARGAPALGILPERLAEILERLTHAPVRAALILTAGVDAMERALDCATVAIGRASWSLALATDRAEVRGFSDGGDRLAGAISAAGERLRPLQTGKLYLYTLGLFLWAGGALCAGVVLLLR